MPKLNDDQLWEKCKEGGPITREDLGLTNSGDEPFYYTEGIRESIKKDTVN